MKSVHTISLKSLPTLKSTENNKLPTNPTQDKIFINKEHLKQVFIGKSLHQEFFKVSGKNSQTEKIRKK